MKRIIKYIPDPLAIALVLASLGVCLIAEYQRHALRSARFERDCAIKLSIMWSNECCEAMGVLSNAVVQMDNLSKE